MVAQRLRTLHGTRIPALVATLTITLLLAGCNFWFDGPGARSLAARANREIDLSTVMNLPPGDGEVHVVVLPTSRVYYVIRIFAANSELAQAIWLDEQLNVVAEYTDSYADPATKRVGPSVRGPIFATHDGGIQAGDIVFRETSGSRSIANRPRPPDTAVVVVPTASSKYQVVVPIVDDRTKARIQVYDSSLSAQEKQVSAQWFADNSEIPGSVRSGLARRNNQVVVWFMTRSPSHNDLEISFWPYGTFSAAVDATGAGGTLADSLVSYGVPVRLQNTFRIDLRRLTVTSRGIFAAEPAYRGTRIIRFDANTGSRFEDGFLNQESAGDEQQWRFATMENGDAFLIFDLSTKILYQVRPWQN